MEPQWLVDVTDASHRSAELSRRVHDRLQAQNPSDTDDEPINLSFEKHQIRACVAEGKGKGSQVGAIHTVRDACSAR
jgi:hypothetical protein